MLRTLADWAERHTREGRFSPVGVAFHWSMSALMLFQLGWGWYASRLPVGGGKVIGYQIHSSVGLLIFVLAFFRFGWRLLVKDPVNDADRPGLQAKIAHWTAWVFYLGFFGLPLTGWAMWSSLGDGEPLAVAGVIPWPQMPFEELSVAWQWTIMTWSADAHQWLIIAMVVLIPLHIGAALKHHFWDRHDVLEGMLPHVPDEEHPRGAPPHRRRPNGSQPVSSPG